MCLAGGRTRLYVPHLHLGRERKRLREVYPLSLIRRRRQRVANLSG